MRNNATTRIDEMKTRLILTRMVSTGPEHYFNIILPNKESGINYTDTIDVIYRKFTGKLPLHKIFKSLKTEELLDGDFTANASR